MRDPTERLRDMLEAIPRIERYAARGRQAFEQDELVQTWVVHHLQIVRKAAARLGRDFHAAYPRLPLPQVVAMRNVLVHDYFRTGGKAVTRRLVASLTVEMEGGRRFDAAIQRSPEELGYGG